MWGTLMFSYGKFSWDKIKQAGFYFRKLLFFLSVSTKWEALQNTKSVLNMIHLIVVFGVSFISVCWKLNLQHDVTIISQAGATVWAARSGSVQQGAVQDTDGNHEQHLNSKSTYRLVGAFYCISRSSSVNWTETGLKLDLTPTNQTCAVKTSQATWAFFAAFNCTSCSSSLCSSPGSPACFIWAFSRMSRSSSASWPPAGVTQVWK